MVGKQGHNLAEVNKRTRFSSDNQPTGRGRPKKLENQLRDLFKNPDITDKERGMLEKTEQLLLECFLAKDTWLEIWAKMLEKTEAELEDVANDKTYPLGFRMVAKALLQDFEKAKIESLLTMFTRKYGSPHQPNTGVSVNMNRIDFHNSPISYEEAARIYEEELRNP